MLGIELLPYNVCDATRYFCVRAASDTSSAWLRIECREKTEKAAGQWARALVDVSPATLFHAFAP